MRSRLAAVLALAIVLSGCASTWIVDSTVRSYSELAPAPAPGATYRFERLPSQQADEARQQRLEGMAAAALEGVGLRRDDAAAQYSAQIDARVTVESQPWADPWFGGPWWGPGPGCCGNPRWGYGPGWRGAGWYGGGWWGPAFPPPASPWYLREVGIVLRELPSNRVVYETHARNAGPNSDSEAIFPVMFQAALQDFPNPPQGERRVDLPVPAAPRANVQAGSPAPAPATTSGTTAAPTPTPTPTPATVPATSPVTSK